MYNSSRTRVTVFFSSKAKDIIDVLNNGMQQEIMGKASCGYMWTLEHISRTLLTPAP